jgi:glycosyltransferase involved in cell wall biosynthesis
MNDEARDPLARTRTLSLSAAESSVFASSNAILGEKTPPMGQPKMKTASVVINTYNRAAYLGNAIRSIAYQSYPAVELIVVNGPSTDSTEGVLESLRKSGIALKTAKCTSRNLSESRNIGIAETAGDVVFFIDDDAVAHPDWIALLMASYADPGVGGAGGFTIDHTGIGFQCRYTVCDRFGNASLFNLIDPTQILERLRGFYFPSLLGTNCSFRRSDLLAINGFDQAYAYFLDETDVCLRLFNKKRKIVTVPQAMVFHKYAPSDLRSVEKIPNSLLACATSKAHFVTKHAAEGRRNGNPALVGHAELEHYTRELQFSNRWYLDHKKISAEHYLRLDADLQQGIADGLRSGLEVSRAPGSVGAKELDKGCSFISLVGERRAASVRDRLKIYFVSQGYPPADTAGIARWTHECAKSLTARGHEVHVLTKSTTSSNFVDYVDGVWIHFLVDEFPENMRRSPVEIPDSLARRAAAVCAEITRADSIWGVDVISAPIWDLEGLFCVKYLQKPVVTSLHTTYLLALPSKPEWSQRREYRRNHVEKVIRGEKWLLENSVNILANSRQVVREIDKAYGLSLEAGANRVHLIPHGIEETGQSARMDPKEGANSSEREEPVSILFVGRIERRKGVEQLLQALLRLRPSASKLMVNIVGSWPSTTDYYARDVTALANAIAAKRRNIAVNFTGYVSDENLAGYYANADIFVAPSRFESFGLIVVEAMRSGCAVIASDIGGMREIVDEATGFLVGVDDSASLAARLETLVSDKELRCGMGAAGRRKFEGEFTANKMAANLETYFRMLRKVEFCQ